MDFDATGGITRKNIVFDLGGYTLRGPGANSRISIYLT
jgi:hypothetical protein